MMKALTVIGIALCLALLLVSGVATGAQGPLALRQGSGQASGGGGCVAGDSYDPVCDVNRDDIINVVDLQLVASHWRHAGTWTSDYWSLTGNPNTTPGTNFLGTTDNVALEVRVNNQGALRLEPTTGTPNLIAGYGGNSVAGGVVGATIGGGGQASAINRITSDFATVGGGEGNTAMSFAATIGGGETNAVLGFAATVGGGANNVAGNVAGNANFATVGGGIANIASNEHATVGGGISNTASGKRATVPGGHENTASGDYSFAAGRRAKADHDGAFVWGDSTDAEIHSGNDDQFIVRANGGLWFGAVTTTDPFTPTIAPGVFISTSTGAYLSSGGDWTNASDRDAKANFTPVNEGEVLARLGEIPITTWNYKSQNPSIRHIGPMAQDFHAAFGVGEDDTHISTLDADGVALAAIQGLYQIVQEQEAQIAALQRQNADLEARLAALEGAMQRSQ
ncbi:MAG: tail fiber domain-containing protein [Candidatus Methylomirabilales bacterium]